MGIAMDEYNKLKEVYDMGFVHETAYQARLQELVEKYPELASVVGGVAPPDEEPDNQDDSLSLRLSTGFIDANDDNSSLALRLSTGFIDDKPDPYHYNQRGRSRSRSPPPTTYGYQRSPSPIYQRDRSATPPPTSSLYQRGRSRSRSPPPTTYGYQRSPSPIYQRGRSMTPPPIFQRARSISRSPSPATSTSFGYQRDRSVSPPLTTHGYQRQASPPPPPSSSSSSSIYQRSPSPIGEYNTRSVVNVDVYWIVRNSYQTATAGAEYGKEIMEGFPEYFNHMRNNNIPNAAITRNHPDRIPASKERPVAPLPPSIPTEFETQVVERLKTFHSLEGIKRIEDQNSSYGWYPGNSWYGVADRYPDEYSFKFLLDETTDWACPVMRKYSLQEYWKEIREEAYRETEEYISKLKIKRDFSIRNYPNLTRIPAILFKFTTLTHLEFKKCHLFSIPEEIGDLVNLVDLDVSRNYISCLPKRIKECKKLENLNLSYNCINKPIDDDLLPPNVTVALFGNSVELSFASSKVSHISGRLQYSANYVDPSKGGFEKFIEKMHTTNLHPPVFKTFWHDSWVPHTYGYIGNQGVEFIQRSYFFTNNSFLRTFVSMYGPILNSGSSNFYGEYYNIAESDYQPPEYEQKRKVQTSAEITREDLLSSFLNSRMYKKLKETKKSRLVFEPRPFTYMLKEANV